MSVQKPVKHIAKETLFISMSLACLVIIIIITSIANAGLDPSKIWTVQNLSNVLINASITLFATIAAVPSGVANTKQRVNPDGTKGRYLQDFNAYNTIRETIEPRRFMFHQWHHVQYLKECRDKKINYLLQYNIMQAEDILELSREQIVALTVSQKYTLEDGRTVYYKALTPYQIEKVLATYDGKVTVHKLPDFYFLYIDGKPKRSFYDQAYYEAKDESLSFIVKLMFKLTVGFVTSCIFTGLYIDFISADAINKAFVLKCIINIFARLFCALSSTLWGFLLGQENVYKQCYYINGKTQFLKSFDSDKEFQYKDVQTIAKEEFYKEREVISNGNEAGTESS